MNLAPCATCGSGDLDVRVVDHGESQLFHVICKACYQEWVE